MRITVPKKANKKKGVFLKTKIDNFEDAFQCLLCERFYCFFFVCVFT